MGNSVIYRPAYDAEVEYLESTGTQYIDTGFIPDDTCGMYVRAYPLNTSSQKKVAGCGSTVQSSASRWWINFASSGDIEISWNGFNKTIPYNKNQWYEVTNNFLNSRTATIDGVNQNVPYPTLRDNNYTAYIFNVNSNVPNAYVGKISSVKFSRGSEIVMDFIPVRIGSVGYMYDKVSKQLFGNKGTGQFILGSDVSNAVIPQQRCVLYFGNQRSVGFERIYEEYEWLKGDKAAYINTGLFIDDFRSVYLYFKYKNFEQFDRQTYILGTGGLQSNYFNITTAWNYSGKVRISNVANGVNNLTSISGTHEIEIKNDKVYGDGVSYNNYNNRWAYVSHYYLQVFAMNGQNQSTGSISNLTITDDKWNINLVPCKLLTSIPAILDGNGIARQAGECGMWDKVSNRFYGNVANSGSFTVEGAKCYEEYEWLKGDAKSYINLGITTLQNISTIKIKFDVNGYENSSQRFFGREYGDRLVIYYTNNSLWFWDASSGSHGVNAAKIDTVTFDIPNKKVKTATMTTAMTYNESYTGTPFLLFGVNMYGTVHPQFAGKISSFIVDNSMHLVPCKLTRGIPASMDANGIARPSGECGMWDKVNDKFYGNVGSGSFTVSND